MALKGFPLITWLSVAVWSVETLGNQRQAEKMCDEALILERFFTVTVRACGTVTISKNHSNSRSYFIPTGRCCFIFILLFQEMTGSGPFSLGKIQGPLMTQQRSCERSQTHFQIGG